MPPVPPPPESIARDHISRGEYAAAQRVLQGALTRAPNDLNLLTLMAGVLIALNQPARAEYFASRCVELNPGAAGPHAVMGDVLRRLNRPQDAAAAYERALAIDPSLAAPLANLARIRSSEHRYDQAEALLRRAPQHLLEVASQLASVLLDTGRATQAFELAAANMKAQPTRVNWRILLANLANYHPDIDPVEVSRLHASIGALLSQALGEIRRSSVAPLPAPDEPIRVGFLSADFYDHPVPRFLLPILRHLDRERFHITCYNLGRTRDQITDECRALADSWHDLLELSDDQAGTLIVKERTHVLFDLVGLTRGLRLGLLSQRAAPIQLSWIGYPNSTGLPAIDARFVDGTTDPADSPAVSLEQLVPLDPCFLCYEPPKDAPAPSVRVALSNPITFGSFNVLAKFNHRTADMWAEVLKAVPSSRLLMKSAALADPSVRARVASEFDARGIAPSRLELLGPTKGTAEHLAMYSRIDIALDTIPYNGTTTTCEALWMGVPVVTLLGQSHAGRVGASLLNAAGLPELIARDQAAFVQIAAALAADAPRLSTLHSELRTRLAGSILTDGPAMARRLGAAIETLIAARSA